MGKKRTEKFDCVYTMPPHYHTIPGEGFDVLKSPAYLWLIRQPSIAQFIFNKAKEFMVYDSKTGKWQGKDYAD